LAHVDEGTFVLQKALILLVDVTTLKWKQHKKHMFILTDAGKPIFSRYGAEDNLSTMMALLCAIASHITDDNDEIRFIVYDNVDL
jgi:hypothetical protein